MTKLRWFVFGATLATAAAHSVSAQESSPGLLPIEPPIWMIGDIELTAGGLAGGALSHSWQQSGPAWPSIERTAASGEVRSWLRAQRTLDNGMVLGGRTDLLLLHDRMSGDIYGGNLVERLFGFVQTGFGRVEIGQQDGVAFQMSLTGPEVDPLVSLEARKISLFRNPLTGRDFGQFFNQVTAVETSSNYPKLNYLTPRLFGIQIGASFTPQTVRSPLPWSGNPNSSATEQHDIWETAASYTGYVEGIAVGVTAGYAQGSQRRRSIVGDDLYDWSAGAEFSYTLAEVKLTLGGAYRGTNAYLFDVHEVLRNGSSEGAHLSATVEHGAWRLGAETTNAHAAGTVDYGITGFQTTVGYQFNPAIGVTAGWQWFDYKRNSRVFYNGDSSTRMNAGYLALAYSL